MPSPVVTWDQLITAVPDEQVEAMLTDLEDKDAPSRISNLANAYQSEGIVLALGAGVSKDASVPLWNTLLSELLITALASRLEVDQAVAAPLATVYSAALGESNPVVLARYAKRLILDGFLDKVRTRIYRDASESELLKELARFCNHNPPKVGVSEVITYNFDVLLEENLQNLGRDYYRVDRTEYKKGSGLPLAHVHGSLERTSSTDEWIVLSEEDYHREYADPYSWSNVVQLNAFTKHRCLFVGCSLTDPNMRRLLEAARRRGAPQHFAMIRRTSTHSVEGNLVARWDNQGRPSEANKAAVQQRLLVLARLADEARAKALEALGVTVIWYDAHSEVPLLLHQVRESH